ncbi:MAG: ferrous iron transport protein B, partial [Planctomycetota bacterium]|nr:ferrous iron transport protein B [Planctomycetota bacterium]
VGNYPGVTVERREGSVVGTGITLLDLPGTYSLSARSPDEELARQVLLGRFKGEPRPDAVLVVLDAAHLERHLYLATQIIDLGVPVVIACNMMDAARSRGAGVDCDALSEELGVPVIGTVATRREGVDRVRRLLTESNEIARSERRWDLPDELEGRVSEITIAMRDSGSVPAETANGAAVLWLSDYLSGDAAARSAADRFLEGLPDDVKADVLAAVGELDSDPDAGAAIVESRYAWITGVVGRVVRPRSEKDPVDRVGAAGDRLDHVLTHRVFGPLVFAAIMLVLFWSIFSWAEPLMGLIETGQAALSTWVGSSMAEGPLRSLITDGVINGVGSVLVFFPQICILFLCIGLLEDTGYMARAAFLMDRVMSRAGLHGKSFIPLLSSFACAIPGIMATRTIEDRRDRMTTILVAPLMSCSARLPVYVIVIAAVFGDRTWLKAGVLFGLYAFGTGTALLLAMIFKKTLFAGPKPTFIMELPPYHLPRPWPIIRSMWDQSKLFLVGAGTTIFAVCVIIWALSYYPRLDESNLSPAIQSRLAALDDSQVGERGNILAAEQLRESYIGRMGRSIEPALKPLGFDWRLGIGVLTSFLAREVFVGTMGITFSVGEADETSDALRVKLANATWPDGRTVLTPLTGVSLMVFYVLACQCVSTLAVTKRETGSWRWPAFMFGYMTVLAYVASLVVYQIGGRLGLGV